MSQLLAAVVGGFLAAGTGWFLQWRLEASRLKLTKSLLVTGIVDDLKSSVSLYERLIDEWEKSGTIWFTTLNELRESRQIYLKNRDWLVLVKAEDLRQRVFKYYHRSSDHINLLENQQSRKYVIQQKLNEIIRDIKLRQEGVTHKQALEQAVNAMQAEDQELVGINELIPQNIQKVRDYRDEAKELVTALQKERSV
ncbi:hypothetical protein [Desulfuromonas sp. TF]|uniref:hypothetical protein n=1 Tax=Desulfuromonas sp. TF TaxID=1232410 RepID=UPI0004859A2D|nr:hypothetical protein [Desulfuromonas sp. TF]